MILCSKCNRPILDTYLRTSKVSYGRRYYHEYYHMWDAPNDSRIVSMSSVVKTLANLESSASELLLKDRKGLTNGRKHRGYRRRSD